MDKLSALLLGNGKNALKKAYIWNTTAGMLNAFQSVMMLMVLTRATDLSTAGVFTIAYTTANLLLNLGLYGMREFLVSDAAGQYTFREYRRMRALSIGAMIAAVSVYMILEYAQGRYTAEKCIIVFLMTLLKAQDVFEDTYTAWYQKKGRLDVGAKITAIRMVLTVVSFAVFIVCTKSLLWTLAAVLLFNAAYMLLTLSSTDHVFIEKEETCAWRSVKRLAIALFPLCAGWVLSYYLGNAPKYAIDSLMTEEAQACFGFISMPIWVVGILSNFIYRPILTKMTDHWHRGERRAFIRLISLQAVYILIFTLCTLLGGWLLGIPVLSWLYSTDLSAYLRELMLLLFGGGLYALSRYFVVVITLMRRQRSVLWCYLAICAMEAGTMGACVRTWGMMGACAAFIGATVLICAALLAVVVIGIRKGASPVAVTNDIKRTTGPL